MYQTRNDVERRLIEAIVSGDDDARVVYSDMLEERGDLAQAMFLRFDPAKLDPEWLSALGWVVGGHSILRSAEPGCNPGTRPSRYIDVQCDDPGCELPRGHLGQHYHRWDADHGNIGEEMKRRGVIQWGDPVENVR